MRSSPKVCPGLFDLFRLLLCFVLSNPVRGRCCTTRTPVDVGRLFCCLFFARSSFLAFGVSCLAWGCLVREFESDPRGRVVCLLLLWVERHRGVEGDAVMGSFPIVVLYYSKGAQMRLEIGNLIDCEKISHRTGDRQRCFYGRYSALFPARSRPRSARARTTHCTVHVYARWMGSPVVTSQRRSHAAVCACARGSQDA